MANNRDIQVLMRDEGLIPGYHASDEEDGGAPGYVSSENASEEKESEEEEEDSDLDNRPLIEPTVSDSSSNSDDDMCLSALAGKNKKK
jgi:hypothetical protein